MKTRTFFATLASLLLLPLAGGAQQGATEELIIPLSRPGQPVRIEAAVIHGTITVAGHDGGEVIVETRIPETGKRHRPPAEAEGLRRIPNTSFGLGIEEEDNRIRLTMDGRSGGRVHLRVPRRSSLEIKNVNGGDLVVEGVEGEIELGHTNGGIVARDVAGTVVAHTTNGNVEVIFDRVTPGKPMSFATLNGNVTVTFPPAMPADLELRSDNGDIYTDFDIDLRNESPTVDTEREGGRYRVRLQRDIRGTINGGGPLMRFRTFNGNIYVRKAAR